MRSELQSSDSHPHSVAAAFSHLFLDDFSGLGSIEGWIIMPAIKLCAQGSSVALEQMEIRVVQKSKSAVFFLSVGEPPPKKEGKALQSS